MDITVLTTVVVTVYITIRVTNRLDTVNWGVIRDIWTLSVKKESVKLKYILCLDKKNYLIVSVSKGKTASLH